MSFDSEGSGIDISLKWKPKRMTTHSNDDDRADLYAKDPLANEEWTAKYQKMDADKELERALKNRLEGNDM